MLIVLGVWLRMRAPYSIRAYNAGTACLAAGEYEESIKHLTASLDQNPSQPDALFERAQAYVELEDYHSAIRDLKAAVELTSGQDGRQHALLAYCLNRIDSHAVAASCYDRAISCGFRTAAVYNNLGVTHRHEKRFDSANKALDKAVAIGQHEAVVLQNRAITWNAAAARESRYPLEAIRDVAVMLERGRGTASEYAVAAKVYGHASMFDTSNTAAGVRYLKLAVAKGMPLNSISSDPFLAHLLRNSEIPVHEFAVGQSQSSTTPDRFIHPVP
mgnify:CR=1 FL=1